MQKIAIVVESFGFGPLGRVLSFVDDLKEEYSIALIGDKNLKKLTNNKQFDFYYDIRELQKNPNLLQSLINSCNLMISSMDTSLVNDFHKANVPIMYIEGLDWLRSDINYLLEKVDWYVRINTGVLGGNDWSKIVNIKNNAFSIGPIIDEKFNGLEKINSVLINLGGMNLGIWQDKIIESGIRVDIIKLFLEKLNLNKYQKIILSGNSEYNRELLIAIDMSGFRGGVVQGTLSHNEFLRKLSQASMFITTPGGQASMEAFHYKIPVLFLPPTNDSQLIWLSTFIKKRIIDYWQNYNHIFGTKIIFSQKTEDFLRGLFLKLMMLYANNQEISKLSCEMNNFINDDVRQEKQIIRQTNYLNNLGVGGKGMVLEKITDLLK